MSVWAEILACILIVALFLVAIANHETPPNDGSGREPRDWS